MVRMTPGKMGKPKAKLEAKRLATRGAVGFLCSIFFFNGTEKCLDPASISGFCFDVTWLGSIVYRGNERRITLSIKSMSVLIDTIVVTSALKDKKKKKARTGRDRLSLAFPLPRADRVKGERKARKNKILEQIPNRGDLARA